jgi:RNA polymerase sigma factor (sigma-70 family)
MQQGRQGSGREESAPPATQIPKCRSAPARHAPLDRQIAAKGGRDAERTPVREDVAPTMRDDPSAAELMMRARNGEKQAWDVLVERYAPLIWSICRRYRLGHADAGKVGQSVWLQLVDQLATAGDPAAIPGWLATTTQRECGRIQRAAGYPLAAGQVLDARSIAAGETGIAEQELVLAERNAALREGFAHLPRRCQQLIAMLIEDPPVPHAEISAALGIPVESIERHRDRCLDKLRQCPALAGLQADYTQHQ